MSSQLANCAVNWRIVQSTIEQSTIVQSTIVQSTIEQSVTVFISCFLLRCCCDLFTVSHIDENLLGESWVDCFCQLSLYADALRAHRHTLSNAAQSDDGAVAG